MDLRLPWLQNARNGGRPGAQNPLFMRGRGNIPVPGQQQGNNIGMENARGDDGIPVQIGMNLKKILDELNMCIVPDHQQRLACLIKVAEVFDHKDRTRHDYELREGAAKILYQKLALALTLYASQQVDGQSVTSSTATASSSVPFSYNSNRPSSSVGSTSSHGGLTKVKGYNANIGSDSMSIQRMRSTRSPEATDADYEIALLCACLEMVHRASSEGLAFTWKDIGCEALPILIKVMERPFLNIQKVLDMASNLNQSANATERALNQVANRENKISVQKITKILALYSLVPEAKVTMASSPGLLSILVKITDTHNINRMKNSMRPISKRYGYLGANASSDDQSVESEVSLATSKISVGGNGIKGASSGVGLYMTEAARFNAIATLTNLAAVEENRMIMLSEQGLLDNIARVVHNERSDMARHCSALAIMNLSNGDREHVPELGSDLLLESIIKLLKDDVMETRRNAVIALFNVACADQNTVKLVRYRNGRILDVLTQIIAQGNEDSDSGDHHFEHDSEVKTNAAEALFNMSCSSIIETTDRIANHPSLLETLALALRSPTDSRDVKIYCAATLRRMAEIIHAPKKSQMELLSALVKASSWIRTACIAEAFLSQSEMSENREVMIEHHGLLNALSKLALTVGGSESDRVRSAAILAIVHLSLHYPTRHLLSKHEGIMMALTRASYESYRSPIEAQADDRVPTSDESSLVSRGSTGSHFQERNDPQGEKEKQIQMALKHLVSAM